MFVELIEYSMGYSGNEVNLTREGFEMSLWVDCDERMPDVKDEESSVGVLLWIGPNMIVSGWRDYNDGEWYDFDGEMVNDVAYWSAMPADPE